MNYFFAANFVLLLASIFTARNLVIQCARDRPIVAAVLRLRRSARTEYRFFPDFSYTMGIIYSFMCGLLFLSNSIEVWYRWGLFAMPSAPMVGNFIVDRQIFFYFLTALGITMAFFILPDRTMKLQDAQPAFVSFSLAWLTIALLGIILCKF